MSYKSPIEIICGNIESRIENGVYNVVQSYGINVDKEELIKALEYDRKQYQQGYVDAKVELERKWIPVTETLPKNNNDVLLQFPSNMGVGYFEDGYWCIVTGEDLYCGLDDGEEKPVAWMPLPEPWSGEE